MAKQNAIKISAHLAFVWLLFGMAALVDFQLALAQETAVAKIAPKLLLAVMDEHVRIQRELCHELRVACGAREAPNLSAFRLAV